MNKLLWLLSYYVSLTTKQYNAATNIHFSLPVMTGEHIKQFTTLCSNAKGGNLWKCTALYLKMETKYVLVNASTCSYIIQLDYSIMVFITFTMQNTIVIIYYYFYK